MSAGDARLSGSVWLAAERAGATVRVIPLYERPGEASAGALVAGAVRPETRLLAITWVHSDTGVRLPVPEISRAVGSGTACAPWMGERGIETHRTRTTGGIR